MNRVIIAHCWDGYPEYAWYPYVKRELEKKGFVIKVPALPDTQLPNLKKWLPVLSQAVGRPDLNTYLVGHSAGCITILRYLELLVPDEAVAGAVLVAGFTDDLGYSELKNFFETPIDFETIKTHCPKFVLVHSDNDPYVPLKHGEILRAKLHAKLIVKHEAGHFSGEDLCFELPEVVSSVAELAESS